MNTEFGIYGRNLIPLLTYNDIVTDRFLITNEAVKTLSLKGLNTSIDEKI